MATHAIAAQRTPTGTGTDGLVHRIPAQPLWVIAAATAGILAALGLWLHLGQLRADYGDVDDALRMVQVRELMAGGAWFDTTLARIGGPGGMLSHWSRLIDGPLALLLSLLTLAMPESTAEAVLRTLWPSVLLVPLLYVVGRTVEAAADRTSALTAMALLVLSPSALIQFSAGRIDHHNAQNLGAVAAVLLLWVMPRAPWAGRWAGIAAGLAVAVGYEALPLVLAASALAAIWGLVDSRVNDGVRAYVLWLAGTLIIAFLGTIPASRWLDIRCDALSFNLLALAVCGAGGLSLVLGAWRGTSLAQRLTVLGIAGAAGLVLYAAADPRCLAGPLGQVPAALKPIWLDHVVEAQGWSWLLATAPAGALSCAAMFGLAMAAQWRRVRHHRDPADVFLGLVLLAAVALSLWQIKYLPYASCLAIVPVAIAIGDLRGTAAISATTARLAGVAFANQWTLLLASALVAPLLAGATPPVEGSQREAAAACFDRAHLAALDRLPEGLMLAPIDLGAHILAETRQSVLAGPYHRAGQAILDTHAVFSATDPTGMRARIGATGARTIVICPALKRSIAPFSPGPSTLDQRLRRGDPPPFLEPLDLPAGSPFLAWRVKTAGVR